VERSGNAVGLIALVAGPAGPFAWSQLATKAGKALSIADLDYYVDWLSKQLTGMPASSSP